MSLPRRIFLDTCVLNFILDYGDQIHESIEIPAEVPSREAADIDSLNGIWDVGQRAFWELAVSPLSYRELASTTDVRRASQLGNWFVEIWNSWREIIAEGEGFPSFLEAEEIRLHWLSTGILDILPDVSDRWLICDALIYRCDLFCTRDWRTILKHRDELAELPIRIVTPREWWNEIEMALKASYNVTTPR